MIGVRLHRLDDQVPPHAVEELPDVQVDHPVALPAALPACRHRVQRRLAGPVPVGVRVEHRFHRLLQPGRGHGLRDPVRDSRHPEHAGPSAMRLRVSPPPSPGAGSRSPTTSGSRSYTGCSSDPSRMPRWTARPPPARPYSPSPSIQASHTSRLEIRNGLPDAFSSSMRLLPGIRPVDQMNNSHGRPGPFAPPPLQGPHRYYGPVRQRARHRYSRPSRPRRLGHSLSPPAAGGSIGARLLTFRTRAADQAHAASAPGTAWPVNGHPARLIPGHTPSPRF